MKRAEKVFYLGLLLFAFFPIIPNKLKGLPVIILLLTGSFLIFKKKNSEINLKKIIIYASLYLLYIISLLYTSNFDDLDKTLTTRISILIFPLLFGLTHGSVESIDQRRIRIFLWTYFAVSVLYCIIIATYIYQIGFINQKWDLNLLYSNLTYEMRYINQHPIYASIFISLGWLFGIKLLSLERNVKLKIVLITGQIILFSMLLFLSRKGVLLATILASISLLLYLRSYFNYKILLLGTLTIFGLIFFMSPITNNRFQEVFNFSSYAQFDSSNSTSVRFAIYKCAVKKIKEKPIIGHGIGDLKDELDKCYSNISPILLRINHNSHNQFLSIWLSNGVIGLIVFIYFLVINFKQAIFQKNKFFLSLMIFFSVVMFFENILERQSGVILFSFFINFFAFLKIEK